MGTVYLALAGGLGQFRKLLVVKELRQDLTRTERFVSMFMDEARLAARLDHPNVVQTFEAGREQESYFIAMEYLDGQPLSALIERFAKNGLPLWVHIHILCEVLAGLHYAHQLPDYDGSPLSIVHRDVSPQNIFVTYHGQVKVVDFGVAKAADATEATNPGMFKGKFAYAAPEQMVEQSSVDARSDVFAVGILLWEAIARRRFSGRQGSPSAWRARAEGTEPRIRQAVPDVNPELARICDRALAVDRDKRYASADAFRADLQQYMQNSGVRIEDSEVGQMMRDAFDAERRTMHALIEQAMKLVSPSPTSGSSPTHETETEVTTVADLSRLVDVSLERDDHKIRDGYAQTRLSQLRSGASNSQALPTTQGPAVRGWLIASVVMSGICMIGFGLMLYSHFTAADSPPADARSTPLPAPLAAPEPGLSLVVDDAKEVAREQPNAPASRPAAPREAQNPPARRPAAPAAPARPARGRQPAAAAPVEADVREPRPTPSEPARSAQFEELPAANPEHEQRKTKRAAETIYVEDPYR